MTLYRFLQKHSPASYAVAGTLLVIFVLAALYQEENWRGKRAWERCQRHLESKGAVLDWRAWNPAPVRASGEVSGPPELSQSFAPSSDSLRERFLAAMAELNNTSRGPVLAQVRILSPAGPTTESDADFVLRYVSEGGALFLEHGPARTTLNFEPGTPPVSDSSAAETVAIVKFDDVPLPDAVRNLSRHAGLNCVLDPKLFGTDPETGEIPRRLPWISLRLQDVTAEQALICVLNRYGFELVPGRRQSSGRHVRPKDPYAPWLWASAGTQEALKRSLEGTLGRATAGVQHFVLLSHSVDEVKPVRIDIRTERLPGKPELAGILPSLMAKAASGVGIRFSFEQTAKDAFEVRADRPVYGAAEYLAWSDQFKPDFETIPDELKRAHQPVAGNRREFLPNSRNLVLSILQQMLQQRAQAYLLLDRPDAALEQLSLAHELGRLWRTRPVDRAAAMRNMALTATYVDVVAEGLRLGAWHDRQLAALESQLQEIGLAPVTSEALQYERALCLQRMGLPADELGRILSYGTMTNLWQVFRYPAFLCAKLAPAGWRYENMALAAMVQQRSIDIYDPQLDLILPSAREAAESAMHDAFHPWSPRTCLASALTPDLNYLWVMTARAQTTVKEAVVACALERYRLARGQFPEKLQQLVPQFIECLPRDVVSGDSFSYRLLHSSRFLLYSSGWNLTDDGGLAHPQARIDASSTEGDWVWPGGA